MKTITLHINQQPMTLPSPITVAQLLRELKQTNPYLAVAINDTIVPRATHATHELQDHDRLLIVTAQGGG